MLTWRSGRVLEELIRILFYICTDSNYIKQESRLNIIDMLDSDRKTNINKSGGSQGNEVSSGKYKGGEMVKLFLEHGADVNIQCDGGSYPLHYAVISGNKAACKLLLKVGARINATDYERATVSTCRQSFSQ